MEMYGHARSLHVPHMYFATYLWWARLVVLRTQHVPTSLYEVFEETGQRKNRYSKAIICRGSNPQGKSKESVCHFSVYQKITPSCSIAVCVANNNHTYCQSFHRDIAEAHELVGIPTGTCGNWRFLRGSYVD